MFFRKKPDGRTESKAQAPLSPGAKPAAGASGATGKGSTISVRETSAYDKPLSREFPGPPRADVLLRVAFERSAYAELIAHAKESLQAEVCGVLAGQVCSDDEGLFVHVEACIRGSAASEGSTHVTFTQATWNAIHSTLERDFPKLRMVGWYHTHPGFGVEFSEMDLFIQKNFFSRPTQIAVVTDPLNGAVAICVNTPQGIEYISRFWVDGREQLCPIPPGRASAKPAPGTIAAAGPDLGGASGGDINVAVRGLEARVSQLIQVIDEQRASFHRLLMTMGLLVCGAIIICVGYFIYSQFVSRNEPPKLNSYVPVPVQVGDKTVLIGVGVAEWQVPPELNATLLQMEKLKQDAAEKAAVAESNKLHKAKLASKSAPPSTNTTAR